MAAGKHNSAELSFTIDASDGGTPADITQYLTKIGDYEVSRGNVTSTPFGATSAQYLIGVFKDYPAFTIEGFYDDTASTGPDAILNIGKVTHEVTRTYCLTFATGKSVTGECWITSYKRTTAVGEYHGFAATLQPTGVPVEA